jgi:hypothetical protein
MAAHDLAHRRGRGDVVAGAFKRIRGSVALQVFVEVIREVSAGSADRRGDVVGSEKRRSPSTRIAACRAASRLSSEPSIPTEIRLNTERRCAVVVSGKAFMVYSVLSGRFKIPGSKSACPIGTPPHLMKV